MSEGIVIALITGACSFGASLLANASANKKLVTDLKLEVTKNQAITDTKLEELTREVRQHNDFAVKIPVIKNEIKHIEDEIRKYHN